MFEVFSQAELIVKQKMATPDFISDICRRAKFGSLNETHLLCIVRSMNNLAMDKAVVALLWQTELAERLIEFLDVDQPNFVMTDIHGAAFSAVFHLSRVRPEKETVPRIAPIIPATVYLITHESPLKALAVTLFLECINHHSDNPEMADQLRRHKGFDALFGLLETHTHKETVMSAIEAWGKREQQLVEDSLLENMKEFTRQMSEIFVHEPPSIQDQVARHLLQLTDKCPKLKTALALSPLVRTFINRLLGDSLGPHPELRKGFIQLVVSCYEAAEDPKLMTAEFRIGKVAQKLVHDHSQSVRPIAEQLLQAVASNYVS
jgi:hypothetical protein